MFSIFLAEAQSATRFALRQLLLRSSTYRHPALIYESNYSVAFLS